MQPSHDDWGPSDDEAIPSLSLLVILLSRNTGLSRNGNKLVDPVWW